MSAKIYIPDRLRYSIAKGKGVFEVDGGTVSECLDQIARLLPGINKSLFYDQEKRALHSYVKVLLNQKRVENYEFAVKVKDGDKIRITMSRN